MGPVTSHDILVSRFFLYVLRTRTEVPNTFVNLVYVVAQISPSRIHQIPVEGR